MQSASSWRGIGIALAACIAAGACSSSSGGKGATPPVARFKLSGDTPPSFLDVPFPSDAYLVNGKIIDPLPGAEKIVPINTQYVTHEVGKANGFGQAMFALFEVDDPTGPLADDGGPAWATIDATSLPVDEAACIADTSAVFLIDLAPSDPSKTRIRCRGRVHDDSAASNQRPVVGVAPGLGIVLEEAHPYAAVLTSRVRDAKGNHLTASDDFKALLSGRRAGTIGALYGNAIDKVVAAVGGALASDGAKIVAIAPYTTMSVTKELFAARESLEAMPLPALAWDAASMAPMGAMKFAAPVNGALPAGFAATLDDWLGVAPKLADGSDDPDYAKTSVHAHDHIAAIGTAVFSAVSFLQSKPGGYDALDHATFARNAAGAIVPSTEKPTVPIWVSFTIPTGTMPAAGFPVVIVAHGLPGSRAEAFVTLSNTLASQGWIVAGIDLITNGARAPEPQYQVDQVTDWQNAPGAKYKGPDGFADALDANNKPSPTGSRNGNLDMFGQGVDVGAGRDQPRQMALDIAQLARVLASNPDLSALATGGVTPKIDGTKIAYIGGSFGAITGSVAAAMEPRIRTWVLNVGAGHLFPTAAGAAGTEVALTQLSLTLGAPKHQYFEEASPVIVGTELVLDPYDPLLFARYLVTHPGTIAGQAIAPRNILAFEVVYDATNSNDGLEAWARAAGIGLATPNVGTNANITTMEQVRDPSKIPDRLPLPDVSPDSSGLIHDTPIAGTTAVLVQSSPGAHYVNLTQSTSRCTYPIPYNAATVPLATDKQFAVHQPYLETRATITRFIADAFKGGVPNVTGFKAAVRDFDGDGSPDATDPDPSDPTVK